MSDKTPWAQSTIGTIVIQGLMGPFIGAAVGAVITYSATQAKGAGVDWGIVARGALVFAIVVFLLLSFVLPALRHFVWGGLGKLFRWVLGLRLTTRKGRRKLERSGYDERSAEVAEERRLTPRPRWRVTCDEGDDWIYIHNSGYGVDDVVVRADRELFEFADGAEEGFIKGRLGDATPGGSHGKQVAGRVTKRGEREGVIFSFSWTDQHGERQPMAGGEDLSATAKLAARPLSPVIRPTWRIGKPKHTSTQDVHLLFNGAEDFVGTNIVIDADPAYFTMFEKRELGDLRGVGGLLFAGRPTEAGRVLDVTFTVVYNDVNGDEHTDIAVGVFSGGWG